MHAGGRPTDYCPEIVEKAKQYLTDYTNEGDVIPSVEGLSEYIGKSRTCIYDWAKEEGKEEFSDTLEKLNALQKRVLLNKGLKSEFNSNITKMMLTKHGYSDKVENTSTITTTIIRGDDAAL